MKKFKYKKKLVLFDLDGVLFDTKKNMKYSWDLTSKRFDLKVPFKNYHQFIGRPFRDLLRLLKIKKNFSSIEKSFSDISKKNHQKIKIYPNVREVLSYLKKKNIKIGIVTSKDKFRTKKILQKFNIKIKLVQCPEKGVKGKPHPGQINKILKNTTVGRNNCVYIGDAKVDQLAAKAVKIDFLFAKYGYNIGIKKSKFFINHLAQIKYYI